ncbi:MAG: hypothetical protein JETT_2922 [Candidatus Jettenia ecosi]|uniref:Uncharacterized protein n=1 Tax=Candidatus Jettenia ecosi TaxID=2494326 RepID=A0A533Q848_9BACT|nr:MAG: hypothetical protein JETT_2922 [Candidatus Jettenia ecosi]
MIKIDQYTGEHLIYKTIPGLPVVFVLIMEKHTGFRFESRMVFHVTPEYPLGGFRFIT